MTTNCDKTESKKRRGPGFLVNPFEIGFRGFAGTECADAAELLARELTGFRVAVVQRAGGTEELVRSQPILDADVAFVKSESDLGIAQLVYARAAGPADSGVVAYLGKNESKDEFAGPSDVPYFDVKNDLAALRDAVVAHFDKAVRSVPLYGLVLAGGKSTRMNRDKANLAYHGKPQVEHCAELLFRHCEMVFVSSRAEQAQDLARQVAPQIHDTFLDLGPMGGILSALKAHPHAAWLVLACDLPHVDDHALEVLLKGRNPYKLATAFISENDGFPEPLCAIYEPKSVLRMLHFLGLGYHCPRKVLINSDSCLLKQPAAHVMTNVNSPDEFAEAQRVLALERKGTK